ncbi:hypothetical protein O6H91_03G066000 [Diphasiastrum complanatum]|uniref:Uncharacterized protein n=1 Tax=Diphasiastrum complanatum TaxID=34168 RepID=A0ACC2E781_DIPCM|nr:hypothetical protein O6H91_03G066000 [Diphasiastrum complanatum]
MMVRNTSAGATACVQVMLFNAAGKWVPSCVIYSWMGRVFSCHKAAAVFINIPVISSTLLMMMVITGTYTQSDVDIKVLTAFKQNIFSDPLKWLADWDPGNAVQHCHWTGVQCNYAYQVQAIDLSGMQLGGIIAKELGTLLYLTSLNLSHNYFSGSIPAELQACVNLVSLDLSYNKLSSILPKELGRITTLKKLYLDENNLSGALPVEIGYLQNLVALSIGRNNFNSDIPIAALANLTSLVYLNASTNYLSGEITAEIGNLPYLETLELKENFLSGNLPPTIVFLTRLKVLDLGANDLQGKLPNKFKFMAQLSSLKLYDNYFKGSIPSDIGQLKYLEYLDLRYNKFSDRIPPSISSCKKLQSLRLSHNSLTGTIPSGLGKLAKLSILELSYNHLQGNVPSQLGNLSLLQNLDLSSNKLNGRIPSSLEDCKALVSLDLSNNLLQHSIPDTLKNLEKLNYLNLSKNNLTGSIPEEFQQLGLLSVLDLSINNLSGAIPSSLASSSNLYFLNVSVNRLVGEIPNLASFWRFSASSFLGNNKLCGPIINFSCPIDYYASQAQSIITKKDAKAVIVGSIVLGSSVGFVAVTVLCWWAERFLKSSLRIITAKSLFEATDNFSERNIIGYGDRSIVYKGVLFDGEVVAVKRFSQEIDEMEWEKYVAESMILRKLKHKNIVRVLGCCSTSDIPAVVLELMQNGSLESFLHAEEEKCQLSWDLRLDIAVDVAEGMAYLHKDWQNDPVLHCNIESSNILLDQKLSARLSNVREISQSVLDEATIISRKASGYMPPE